MRYTHLWTRLYCSPLLLEPEKAQTIEAVLRAHLAAGAPAPRLKELEHQHREPERRAQAYAGIALQDRPDKPYAVTRGGVALIPVLGTLVHRGSWLDAESGLTSYDRIGSLVENAIADPDVRGLLLEIDSPGGEANGVPDLAARVRSASKKKPTWAVANEQAYSAAYWVAAAAERLHVPITGGVGSIGALMLHVDQSKRDAQLGYAYTLIHAGARKADFTSHAPLSDRARSWAQTEVDRMHALFSGDVARLRGLDQDTVTGTEAAPLTPPEALYGGFVDAIATLAETVAQLEEALTPATPIASAGRRALEAGHLDFDAAAASVYAARGASSKHPSTTQQPRKGYAK